MADGRSIEADALLRLVRQRYLSSGDYNGLFLSDAIDDRIRAAAVELTRTGNVQVVTDKDYINIHIRPWTSRRAVAEQVADLQSLAPEQYGVCLYPTVLGMKGVRLPKRFDGAPHSQAMARGRGSLELAYFSTDVLEPYRNDARYHFSIDDFGVNMGIGDDAYLDESEPEKDKVSLWHLGFAYDLSKFKADDPDSPIVRRVAAFYGDLTELTPEHQQCWATYQAADYGLNPHPVWFMSQMGHWPDGIGPLYRLFQEIGYISELFQRVWGVPFFTATKKPSDLGWILRADQREWDNFITQLDKVLSENISHAALDAAGVPRLNASGQNLGTLARLEEFMTMNRVAVDRAKWALKPLREVRTARQKPAHALRTNITDKTFVHRQIDLLRDVNEVLLNIRQWLSSHPKNRGWEEQWADAVDYRM